MLIIHFSFLLQILTRRIFPSHLNLNYFLFTWILGSGLSSILQLKISPWTNVLIQNSLILIKIIISLPLNIVILSHIYYKKILINSGHNCYTLLKYKQFYWCLQIYCTSILGYSISKMFSISSKEIPLNNYKVTKVNMCHYSSLSYPNTDSTGIKTYTIQWQSCSTDLDNVLVY